MARSGSITVAQRILFSLFLILLLTTQTTALRLDTIFSRFNTDKTLSERMPDYQVQSGDTGLAIAQKLGVSFGDLSNANAGVVWNNLQLGQILKTPSGSTNKNLGTYTILPGDTEDSVVRSVGIPATALRSANPTLNWKRLRARQVVTLPTQSGSPENVPSTSHSLPTQPTDTSTPVASLSVQPSTDTTDSPDVSIPLATLSNQPDPTVSSGSDQAPLTMTATQLQPITLTITQTILSATSSLSSDLTSDPESQSTDVTSTAVPDPTQPPSPPQVVPSPEPAEKTSSSSSVDPMYGPFSPTPILSPTPPTPSSASPPIVAPQPFLPSSSAPVVAPQPFLPPSSAPPPPPSAQVPPPASSATSLHPSPLTPSPTSTGPATPSSTFDLNAGSFGNPAVVTYSGPASAFPPCSSWQKFSLMWPAAAALMAIHDTPEQIGYIHSAILTVSAQASIDPRSILAVIMQESHGNVHVPTTVSPPPSNIRNPGIMQTHNGVEFDPNNAEASILQMVRDGVLGTSTGPGLKGCKQQTGNIYEAFRMYNSGSVNKDNLSSGIGTPSYVSDIANRLMGAQPN